MTFLSLLLCGLVFAQEMPKDQEPQIAPDIGIEGVAPGMPPLPEDALALAYDISSTLRCPVCQGLSVADSTSDAAIQFQKRVQELVAMGYSRSQIEAFFVTRYGEWVLLDPPKRGLNWLVWLGPVFVLLISLFGIARHQPKTISQIVAAASEDVEDVGRVDPYKKALLEELDS